ncbi:MAG: hypothetical protein ACOYKM_00645 [Caulobacterales bacterium]
MTRLLCATALASVLLAAAAPLALAQSRGSSIESGELSRLDAWSVGAIGRGQGALPPELWSASEPALLGALFDRLPGDFGSPAARTLARRALASPGAAPVGDAQTAGRKRFEALGRIGAAQDISTMTAAASIAADPEIAQYAAQADLSNGRLAPACQRSATAGTGFLLRLRALCAAIEGNTGATDLALSLARETGSRDAWLEQVIALIGGVPAPRPIPARYDSSLSVWASLAANLTPPRNPLAQSSTLALAALATADRGDPRLRAEAALLAFSRGAIDASIVRTQMQAALAASATNAPRTSLAIAQAQALPGSLEAATAIAAALSNARSFAELTAIAQTLQPELSQISLAADAATALTLAKAALAIGDIGQGARLLRVAEGLGATPAAMGGLRAAIAVGSSNISDQAALFSVTQRLDDAGEAGRARALRDVAVLSAMGFPLEPGVRRALITTAPTGGRPADAGLLAALGPAVDAEALGEVALIAAAAAAPGAGTLDAASLTQILVALRQVGLNDDAQRLAVEALVAGP